MHSLPNLISGRNTIVYCITWAWRIWTVVHAGWQREILILTSQISHQGGTATKDWIIVGQFHLLNRWTNSELIDWEHWRSRVASRGPTYVVKGTTTRGPVQWVPNNECVIDRLRVKSWINVMKQDWGDQINPTMTGGVHSVLIWVRMCRTLLGDKGKPLSWDKGMRTDEHSSKIWQWRMARVQTNVYTYEQDRSVYCTRSKR